MYDRHVQHSTAFDANRSASSPTCSPCLRFVSSSLGNRRPSPNAQGGHVRVCHGGSIRRLLRVVVRGLSQRDFLPLPAFLAWLRPCLSWGAPKASSLFTRDMAWPHDFVRCWRLRTSLSALQPHAPVCLVLTCIPCCPSPYAIGLASLELALLLRLRCCSFAALFCAALR